MTVTTSAPAGGTPAERPVDSVTVFLDGIEVTVPKGTVVIRVAEMLGNEIPRFCDHPLLDPVAACRACLVEIEGMPKPQPACAITVSDGMKVRTQASSEVAEAAQAGVMEFLLANHPLDCPTCDKGGECPLQNQAMSAGRPETRFDLPKRRFTKAKPMNELILLDRDRCVSCARCTRFADQIAGDPMLELLERGSKQQVGTGPGDSFDSYFSGNTIQICPVGALTSTDYRFRSRPFDLVSVPTACEHCASGCSLRTDYRHGEVMRRLAWADPQVNEEWNCDKGRFAFGYLAQDRLTTPLVRDGGELRPASWPEALEVAARGLAAARGRVGILAGGRLTQEDAYSYAKFARVALGSDHLDFRARATSAEETGFLTSTVAGSPITVTYSALERAPIVLLAGFEPEDESPIVFLRLRKGVHKHRVRVASVGAVASQGLTKLRGQLIPALPGAEAATLAALPADVVSALGEPGAVILVGERLAASAGALTAAAALAASTGAALAWIPRRAGERGALDAGALAGLLPGGRPLADPAARAEVAAAWGIDPADLPAAGLDGAAIAATVIAEQREANPTRRRVGALIVAGVEAADLPEGAAFLAAAAQLPFVVSLETRRTALTDLADVVLPVAVVTEKAGRFLDWEGRRRAFAAAMRDTIALPDSRVLAMIADAMGRSIGSGDTLGVRRELDALGTWSGSRPATTSTAAAPPPAAPAPSGQVVLATWRTLIDAGSLQRGQEHLAGSARASVALMSAATAATAGLVDGAAALITGPSGSVTLPVRIGEVVDGVVWVPAHAPDCSVAGDLGAAAGALVTIGGAR